MLPVVAIIGRPNVGKSTLFNRLTRTRDALVADRPGVTRDRRYGYGRHGDGRYIVIDTGGLYGEATEDRQLAALVEVQSLLATREADVILWLVDGRSGLTAVDHEIAARLRSVQAGITVVVNKTEAMQPEAACAEFYALGMGEPVAISAEHGIGVGDLLDSVLAHVETGAMIPATDTDALRVGIIGRPNVGKSTLVNRMLGEERMLTFDQPGTTRDSIALAFERAGHHYVLIDTAGVRRRSRIDDAVEKLSTIKSLQTIDLAQLVVVVADAREGITDQDLALLGLADDAGKSLLLAVNKWDGLSDEQRALVRSQIERKLGFAEYACIRFISALHGTGVGELFETMEQIRESRARHHKSGLVTRLLQEAVERHPPPLVRGRRIKLRYAHVGGHEPLRIIVHGNQTGSVPADYQRYLENYFRQKLRLSGTPVRIEFKRGANPYATVRRTGTPRRPGRPGRR